MVFVTFIQILIEHSVSSSGHTDLTQHFAASDLGLYCLPTSHKKDARLICDWAQVQTQDTTCCLAVLTKYV